jgi:hypothetical protein
MSLTPNQWGGKADQNVALLFKEKFCRFFRSALPFANFLVAIVAVVLASDTSDLKSAVRNISALATQTKRQADNMDKQLVQVKREADAAQTQVSVLKNQLLQMTVQTDAIRRTAVAGEATSGALLKQLGVQQAAFKLEHRPQILIVPNTTHSLFSINTSRVDLEVFLQLSNVGSVSAESVRMLVDLVPRDDGQVAAQTRICKRSNASHTASDDVDDRGPLTESSLRSLAAGEKVDLSFKIYDREPSKFIEKNKATKQNLDLLGVLFVGCVSYLKPDDVKRHHVRFMYEVHELDADNSLRSPEPQTHQTIGDRLKLDVYPDAGNDDD